jgi:hypothetical protein
MSIASKMRDCFAPLAMTNHNAGAPFSRCEESFGDEATSFLKTNNSNEIAPNLDKNDNMLSILSMEQYHRMDIWEQQ